MPSLLKVLTWAGIVDGAVIAGALQLGHGLPALSSATTTVATVLGAVGTVVGIIAQAAAGAPSKTP